MIEPEERTINPRLQIELPEYEKRISLLKQGMYQRGIDLALLFHSIDVYYFSGTGTYSILAVPLKGEPVLLVRTGLDRAWKDCWLERKNIISSQGMETLKILVREMPGVRVIGIEKDTLTASFVERLSSLLPENQFQDISPTVLDVRRVKSEREIALMREAARISMAGFRRCEEVLTEGMTEVEIQSEIEIVQRMAGSDGGLIGRAAPPGFGIIAAGPNSFEMSGAYISMSGIGLSNAHPDGPSRRRIRNGDMVVVDKVTSFQGYLADEGRTYVMGRADDQLRKYFEVVRQMLQACLEAIQPGALASNVYHAAKRVAAESGCLEYFMAHGQYGIEYIGHGIGLEVDEPPLITPNSTQILEPGMVIAIEPKLIIPGWGGVDLEDTVVITSQGNELLSQTRRDLIEIIR